MFISGDGWFERRPACGDEYILGGDGSVIDGEGVVIEEGSGSLDEGDVVIVEYFLVDIIEVMNVGDEVVA